MNTARKAAAVAATLALCWGGLVQAGPAPVCDTFHFDGATQQMAPDSPFVGEMTLLNLRTGETDTVEVATMLLGAVSADGRVVTSHEISSRGYRGASLVTFDDARLIPLDGQPGAFKLISHLEVKAGNDVYTCGEMVIGADPDPIHEGRESTLSFDAAGLGSAEYSGFGRLCRCAPSDN